jgi:hypothetical protein
LSEGLVTLFPRRKHVVERWRIDDDACDDDDDIPTTTRFVGKKRRDESTRRRRRDVDIASSSGCRRDGRDGGARWAVREAPVESASTRAFRNFF